jgi:hypothetical protein
MATRNFWITAEIDGRKTPIATGPRRADGGFSVRVKMRADGGRISAVRLDGMALSDGTLRLDVAATDPDGDLTITPAAEIPGLEGNPAAFRLESRR